MNIRFWINSKSWHYDCGCIPNENGDLMHFSTTNIPIITVPTVYVTYFSTFGALAWHLLLYPNSVQQLNAPILSSTAIDSDGEARFRIAGTSVRTRTCHFVRARLLATMSFLSINSNRNDGRLLLNRCFEQFAFLTAENQSGWIKQIYSALEDVREAEEEFQNVVFYHVHGKLGEHNAYIHQLLLQPNIHK
ncbi:unnamed protein product [Didymodactylos carnosus]|uniref:Uncharacterized protein n=1 Tax=Didymodactylos carnosus TaxID=1234261 RepID=A0A815XPN0_9BILA|nr:unnamed protein product [Didymodactylos carnosus]CAF4421871.1 unnamed protein product [Didymodactylos carnosus]